MRGLACGVLIAASGCGVDEPLAQFGIEGVAGVSGTLDAGGVGTSGRSGTGTADLAGRAGTENAPAPHAGTSGTGPPLGTSGGGGTATSLGGPDVGGQLAECCDQGVAANPTVPHGDAGGTPSTVAGSGHGGEYTRPAPGEAGSAGDSATSGRGGEGGQPPVRVGGGAGGAGAVGGESPAGHAGSAGFAGWSAAGSAGEAGAPGGSSAGQLVFASAPSFTGNDNDAAPQVGILRFETNLPTTGTALVSAGSESWTIQLEAPSTWHEQAILGLKPDTQYSIAVTVSDGREQLTAGPVQWRTPVLPANFPPLDFVQSDPSRMEPGMTLFNVRGPYYMIVVDSAGQVRWYYGGRRAPSDHRLLSNGHLIFLSNLWEITKINWRGDVVASWYAEDHPRPIQSAAGAVPVSAQTFHHCVRVMTNGNLLTLSTDSRTVADFPTSTTDPDAATETALVVGDVVTEFTHAGDVVKPPSGARCARPESSR